MGYRHGFAHSDGPEIIQTLQDRVRVFILYCYSLKLPKEQAAEFLEEMDPVLKVPTKEIKFWYRRFDSGDFSLER
ncbi:hypothetical protein GGF46_004007 [Coemansia sp. RSA 552]|nr:hypothetical protein GGF46_004007 [Coemansia sp. RSA 552]